MEFFDSRDPRVRVVRTHYRADTGREEQRHTQRAQAGFSLVEALIATALLALTFLAFAGVSSSNVHSIAGAQSVTRAAMFGDELLNATEAQSTDALLAMNGNSFFDNTSALDSRFRATLSVEEVQVNLLSIAVQIENLQHTTPMVRLVTYRRQR